MRFRAFEAAAALGATVVGPDVEIDGVSFDSRAVAAGQLFAPIVAERDGHTFLPDALARGAVAYLTAQRPIGGTAIVVDDTLDALMRLAAWGRERWGAGDPMRRVVGITGSVGKTSTKDLAAAAITASARTWANERSFNNDQGLPTTILNAPDTTDVMILEMGMRGFGEISRLCSIGRPDLGIVTRVANAHTERVGDLAGVARAKGELIEALPLGGVAILNGDDQRVRAMAGRAPGRAVLYGTMPDCEVHIGEVVLDPMARPAFRLGTPWGSFDVRLAASGAHMAENAAAALSCVGVLGLDVAAGVDALRTASITPMRMEVRRLASGAVLVDDSYNANPVSMRAALDALAAVPATRRVAVLGVMAELADPSGDHREIAAYAKARGIDVIAVGTDLYGTAPVPDPLDALWSLSGGDAVLVKASRAAQLDRVAAALVAREGLVVEH
jgi:UDP-N-acetylmuramoyl-tripeptide--D-alanyl-D-alanine ligase